MGLTIAVVVCAVIIVGLGLWGIARPSPETTYGMERKARKHAKKERRAGGSEAEG